MPIFETSLGRVYSGGDLQRLGLSGQTLGLDVETTYMTPRAQFDPDFRVRLIQVATPQAAWVFNVQDSREFGLVSEVLEDPTVRFCSHTPMDVLSLSRLGFDLTSRNVDTRVLAAMAYTEKLTDRGLKALSTKLLDPALATASDALEAKFKEMWPGRKNSKWEDVAKAGWAEIPIDDPLYVMYAGMDALACRQLLPLLISLSEAPPELLDKELWLAARANQRHIAGALVDLPSTEALNSSAVEITEGAQEKAQEITGGIKLNSPFLREWLSEHGVDWDSWESRTAKGAPSISKDKAPQLFNYPLDHEGKQVVSLLNEFKSGLDVRSKTKEMLRLVSSSGRLHPVLNTVGATATARMSSSAPNIQNFSKEDPRLRGCFIPEDGHTFVTIDFDQVELRVVAGLAREVKMIDTILAGGDLHQLTVDEIGKGGIQIDRATGKMTNFLIVYGGGGKALHEQAGLPLDLAKDIVKTWRDRYPAVRELTYKLSDEQESLRTISGRRLAVKSFRGEVKSYANINYAVQSAARDVLVDAWYRFEHSFGRTGMVWYPVHDELVLQVPEDLVEEVCEDAEKAMTMDFMGVPITASAVVLKDGAGVSRWMKS